MNRRTFPRWAAPRVWPALALLLLGAAARPAAAQQAPSVGDEPTRPRLTKAPKLVKFVEAPYPDSQKAAGRTASVVLQVGISETGTVSAAKVLESAGPDFDAAALAAVEQFLFDPAEIDGKPAAIRINYRYDFVLKEEAPTVAEYTGVVRVHDSHEPLAGVRVEVDDGHSALTDATGHFSWRDVQPGTHRITLSRADMKAMQTEETFEAGKKLDAEYEVERNPPENAADAEADDIEIVIVAPTLTKQVVSTKVEADQAKRVAGTGGDVLKIVENMPGVARAAAGSGQVIVWGAAPEDTRVYVDGMRVPLLYHYGGFRSVIHSDLVSSVELVPGGYGAQYGRGLGGIVTVNTRAPATDGVHGSFSLDLIDAAAAASAPVSDKVSVAIAARRSHLDWVLEQVTSKDIGQFFPIPQYYDGQARVRYQASKREWVEVGGMLSSDELSRTASSSDPAYRKEETDTLAFQRAYLRYEREFADGGKMSVLPWLGWDHSTLTAQFGGTPTQLDLRNADYGLRASYRVRATPFLTAEVGLDLEAVNTDASRVGSITSPPREGDSHIFGQPPSDQVNSDSWSVWSGSAAPYVEGDIAALGNSLHVIPGVRIEPYFTSVNKRSPVQGDTPAVGVYTDDTAIEPRLAVHYAMSSRVTFKAAYGKYRQAAQAEDLSSVFGNPLLGSAHATHVLGGGAFDLSRNIALETTVFYTSSQDLAVRNPLPAPLIAQALVAQGEGRSYGAQFLLRRELANGLFGWVSYTLLRSERKDSPGADWRLFDYDQTHVLTALASYDLGRGFDVGARARYATGFPRTPVIGSYFDTRTATYQPILGAQNSTRIPAFAQLDVRLSKRFQFKTSHLELYLDVQNVTDRANPEEIVYSPDYTQKRYIDGLPLLPVFGAKLEY